jgi:uroporphyrinogen decarboxylase
MNSRERFLAACRGRPTDRPPVWIMRQAGRYLPEYRELRKEHSFWELMRTPDLALELVMQPLRRFGMDAAILFSDILIVLDAMGAKVTYDKGGPRVHPRVCDPDQLGFLAPVDVRQSFDYIREIIERLCAELHPDTAVIGFSGAPFTLASYLVDPGPDGDLSNLRKLADGRPEVYREILERISRVIVDLLKLQIDAGADVVQIFDTWAGEFSLVDHRKLALPFSRSVIEDLSDTGVPVLLYVRNAAELSQAAASTGCDVLSIDSSLTLSRARELLGPRVALQGNLSPEILLESHQVIRQKVQTAIDSLEGRGLIVNLGQGLTPTSPVEGVSTFVKAVKEWAK